MSTDIAYCSNAAECPKRETCVRAHPPTPTSSTTELWYSALGPFPGAGDECTFYLPE